MAKATLSGGGGGASHQTLIDPLAWADALATVAVPPPGAISVRGLFERSNGGLTMDQARAQLDKGVAAGRLEYGIFRRIKWYWPADMK